MLKAKQTSLSGDAMGRVRSSAREVDVLLSELCQLYLERFQALRSGDPKALQSVTGKISILKMKLDQL